ncbi:ferrous iron transporter B [Phragmitibacter flavus]|uniref:Ferrous iron transporter B n=1 Tax=Phragmitibacter flavus TaxID=2576071 RepID=A0A5R8KIV2_9BACT|nr:nucleoside recognition domain-containing protein [Phragmitibacter flavus]TLD72171.1 ferrous iron transporter B [Phragmitibacter flavus]
MKTTDTSTIVLAGLESAGKSALFRGLTGHAAGDEANFRGSTVVCRKCRVTGCACDVVDTPGIRAKSDAATTQLALNATGEADVVLLVARSTDASSEIEILLKELDLKQKRSALAITFLDKAPAEIEALAAHYREALEIPVVLVNSRTLDATSREAVLQAMAQASPVNGGRALEFAPPVMARVRPQTTLFEQRLWGPWLSLLAMAMMFALPVYAAYWFASWAQPLLDERLISPMKEAFSWLPSLPQALLTGGYGVITLGWYSFLWAFPVVVLLALSVAIAEETGLKDRITAALDPWLRRVGLDGRDLIPVLMGFGCNVVAVFQSRSCSSCTRKSCVSMIAFGSACSYQIGASLSIFAASGHPGLFVPYLFMLIVVGALHTRFWHGGLSSTHAQPLHERAFLQVPSARAVRWRVKASLKQFLLQAMPVFLLICIIAALLEYLGVMAVLEVGLAPLMTWLKLPVEAAGAILFSVLRKDGLLTLNSNEGTLLVSMGEAQIFLVVWLASTLTACLVTLWTIKKELGWMTAFKLAGRQAATSAMASVVMVIFL